MMPKDIKLGFKPIQIYYLAISRVKKSKTNLFFPKQILKN